MDADFSHNPVDVPRLITALENADLAIGSRRVSGGKFVGWGAYRYVTSWTAMTLARVILGLRTKDVTAGFRAFRRQTLETILERDIRSNGYAFQEEILFRVEKKGFRVVEIPVTFVNRTTGTIQTESKRYLGIFPSDVAITSKEIKEEKTLGKLPSVFIL